MTETFGYLAALLTTIAFLPQALHTLKTKDTSGISLKMYIVFTMGLICWLVFGLLSDNKPIIVANAVTLIFATLILIMKIKFK